MATPTAVQEKSEKALEMFKQMQSSSVDDTKVSGNVQPQDGSTESQNAEPTVATGDPAQGIKTKIDPSDWKSRYNNLRSSRDDRLEAANRRIEKLEGELASAESEISRLTKELSTSSVPKISDFLSSDDIDDLDEDTVEKLLAFAETVSKYGENVAAQEPRQEQPEFDLEAALDEAFPDWYEINASEGWLKWLQGHDATGNVLDDVLKQNAKAGNVNAIVNMFKSYLSYAEQSHAQTESNSSFGDRMDVQYHADSSGQPDFISGADFKAHQMEALDYERHGHRWSDRRKQEFLEKDAFFTRALQEGRVA